MGIKAIANAELWATRIRDYMNSGITRNEWCQEHQLSISARVAAYSAVPSRTAIGYIKLGIFRPKGVGL